MKSNDNRKSDHFHYGNDTRSVIEANDGYYMRLENPSEAGAGAGSGAGGNVVDPPVLEVSGGRRWNWQRPSCWWIRVICVCGLIAIGVVVIVKWLGPFLIKKAVIPIINWELKAFSKPVLAAVLFASIALFPVLLLPTIPFKWAAGMTFGYGVGFVIVIAAVVVAVSLPYFIGYYLFLPKIDRWLNKHPKEASIVRLAGEGNWFHQFRAILLIRLTPFPYVIFNYTAVGTNVKYTPYLAGTLVGMVPEILFALYSGIMIHNLAQAMEEHSSVSKLQLALDVLAYSVSLAATVIIGFCAKWKLAQLQEQEPHPTPG